MMKAFGGRAIFFDFSAEWTEIFDLQGVFVFSFSVTLEIV